MIKTKKKNKVKPDTILKNFWRDNERFADLFNAILFDGENVIEPEKLKEADTDLSAVLKFNGHADTLQKILDVVKKSAYGVDFVILGLENQQHIHYGMPLRIMLGDTLGYVKEYQEIAKKINRFLNSEADGIITDEVKTAHDIKSLMGRRNDIVRTIEWFLTGV